jgi:hypothetical protein
MRPSGRSWRGRVRRRCGSWMRGDVWSVRGSLGLFRGACLRRLVRIRKIFQAAVSSLMGHEIRCRGPRCKAKERGCRPQACHCAGIVDTRPLPSGASRRAAMTDDFEPHFPD